MVLVCGSWLWMAANMCYASLYPKTLGSSPTASSVFHVFPKNAAVTIYTQQHTPALRLLHSNFTVSTPADFSHSSGTSSCSMPDVEPTPLARLAVQLRTAQQVHKRVGRRLETWWGEQSKEKRKEFLLVSLEMNDRLALSCKN